MRRLPVVAAVALAAACTGGPPPPAPLDAKNDTCSICRMTVSDRRLAAQIAAPGEESRFFDDLGCLLSFLKEHPAGVGDAVYVADHRTGEWTPAPRAIFSRLPQGNTPMASGLIAHSDAESKALDRAAAAAAPVDAELFLRGVSPGATRR